MSFDNEIATRLSNAGVRFYHAENLQNFRTYCQAGALLSRRDLIERDPNHYTKFYSDPSDDSRGVLGRVFGNIFDFGQIFANGSLAVPNIYGPITLVFRPAAFNTMNDIAITAKSIVSLRDPWRPHAISNTAQIDKLLAGDGYGGLLSKAWLFAELSCANNVLPFSLLEKVIVDRIEIGGTTLALVVTEELRQIGIAVPIMERRYGRNIEVLRDLVECCRQLPAGLTEASWPLGISQLPNSTREYPEDRKRRLVTWCQNFFFGTVQALRLRPSPICDSSVFDAEKFVEDILQKLGPKLMDSDDLVTGAMALTNASAFGLDWYEILSADRDKDEIAFNARLHFAGDRDPDRMWCGDRVVAEVFGTAVKDEDDKWVIGDYSVEKCEVEEDMNYEES